MGSFAPPLGRGLLTPPVLAPLHLSPFSTKMGGERQALWGALPRSYPAPSVEVGYDERTTR
jgi:hypothetical protein